MATSQPGRGVVSFGVFELDREAGELRKSGVRIKLQEQPFQVLTLLVECPGDIVTREEIVKKLWPDGTFVEFDRSLNIAVNKIREALGDSASHPRFVETVPRRGYRFVAPVERLIQAVPAEPSPGTPRTLRSSPRQLIWLIATLVIIAAIGTAVWRLGWLSKSVKPPVAITPLTSYAGQEKHPSFSPNGSQVAFSWNGPEQDNFDIYIKLVGPGEPIRLTKDPAHDFSPAWSPDGRQLAFLRAIGRREAGLYTVPALGGAERLVAKVYTHRLGKGYLPKPCLTWSADGAWLVAPNRGVEVGTSALWLISSMKGEKRPLTVPGAIGLDDTSPALSPDGQMLAFVREVHAGYGGARVGVQSLSDNLEPSGEAKWLTSEIEVRSGLAWSPDGRDIIFGGQSKGVRGLWKVPADGSQSPVLLGYVGEAAASPAVSNQGDRLVYTREIADWDIWQAELPTADSKTSEPRKLVSSTYNEGFVHFSPDGEQIVFQSTRSGVYEIWICDRDGSNPRQFTFFGRALTGSPRWSPDGNRIAFDSSVEGNFEIYVADVAGGAPRRLTRNPASDYAPRWSRDGNSVYFGSNRTGENQVWRIAAAGGEAEQLTRGGGFVGQESIDGKYLYYSKQEDETSLWRVEVNGGKEELVLEPVVMRNLIVVEDGIYYVPRVEDDPMFKLLFYRFSTASSEMMLTLDGIAPTAITVSPDQRWLLYVRWHPGDDDLMLVENFR